MAVWFNLMIGDRRIGSMEIRRCDVLGLSDPAAIADTVSTYNVWRDGVFVGQVRHRYGDRAWRLLALAADLVAEDDAEPGRGGCQPEHTGIPELIGRAARLIRDRAQAANTDEARRPYSDDRIDPVPESGWGALVDNYLGGPIGTHCASWTPAVAHAVADWLEIGSNPYACVDLAPMVAVARAYLGEPGPGSDQAR